MRFAIILCCLFVMNTPAAYAQPELSRESEGLGRLSPSQLNRAQRSLSQFTEYYDEVINVLRKGSTQLDYDVSRMRHYYTRSEYYVPFSKSVLNEMTEYAYIVDTSDDKEAVNEALVAYKQLAWSHLAHLDALTLALNMSRLDPRFGDEIFFRDIRLSLLKAIYFNGAKCDEPEMACRIVSYGEETYILGKIGGVLKGSKIYKVSNKYYNVHNLIKDGQEIQIYMDVTEPIVNVWELQAVMERDNADLTAHPQ